MFVCPGLMCTPVFNPRLLHIKDGIPNAKRCWADTQGCKKLIQQVWLKQFQASSFPVQEGLTLRKPRWPLQASTGCLGTARLHSLATLGRAFPLPAVFSPQAAVDWQGLPWRSLCSGSYLCPQESMAPQAHGGQNAFKSLAALFPAQAFSREKG